MLHRVVVVVVINRKAKKRCFKESLNMSFDDHRKCLWCRLSATTPCVALPTASMQSRTNGNPLSPLVLVGPFVVSLSNHERTQQAKRYLKKPGYTSLHTLTAAALILPGLLQPSAHAADDDEVDFQYSYYQEGKRDISALLYNQLTNTNQVIKPPYLYHPIEADSLRGTLKTSLSDRVKFAFNYTQDTWSGATPIGTAPSASTANRAKTDLYNPSVIVGATPYIKDIANAYFDAQGNPLFILGFDSFGNPSVAAKNTQLTHVMSYASPEVRKQGDFNLRYEWDEAAIEGGGGLSVENDYESRFVNLGGRLDFNQKHTSVNLGLSYTNSQTKALLDPANISFLYTEPYRDQIEDIVDKNGGRVGAILRGNRQDWSTQLGLTHILNPDALVSTTIGYTRSTGFMENPYKVVYLFFADPQSAGSQGEINASVASVIEQRPDVRNQLSWNAKYVQHITPLDAALHLNYQFSHDDWGINAHTFDAEWIQPLGSGWTLAPRARYYTQDAANFYTPYLLNPAINPITGGPIGSFSSDQRLSGFGSLSGGLTLSKQFAKGVSFEAGFEYYTHQGSLKLGGGGEDKFADYDYYTANAALKLNLEALGSSGDGSSQHKHHVHSSNAPAGVLFSHALDKAGDFMVGYRYMYGRQSGDLLHGTEPISSNEDLIANGCGTYEPDGHNECAARPFEMDMYMHMLDLMYAPTDWLTLMVMPQFVDMEMGVGAIPGAAVNTGGHNHGGAVGTHATGGVGDTGLYAISKLWDSPNHHLHLTTGFSAPSGDVDLKLRSLRPNVPIRPMHFHMQLGSGTWDFKPSLTYTGQMEAWSWGAQLGGTLRLEDQNQTGYALGNIFQTSAWGGYQLTNWLTATVRGVYTWEGQIKGDYIMRHRVCNRSNYEYADGNGGIFFDETSFNICTTTKNEFDNRLYANLHKGTYDNPSNYGGSYVDVGFGLNVNIPNGAFVGHSLKFEWLQPAYTDVNGYQLDRSGSLSASWSMGF
jgi:Protein of unknown function (DUF3570)